MNDKPLVAIARGGYSGESAVSMKSALQMMNASDKQRFNLVFLTIHKTEWSVEDASERALKFDRGEFLVEGKRIDAVLVAIHGSPGENGLLQGYLDMLDIPYQSGDVLNMSLTSSKFATTGLLRQLGFPVANSVLVNAQSMMSHEAIIASIGLPCFVKPDTSGSSLGISKVKSIQELPDALAGAFEESPMVMIEQAVTGREITCGILGLGSETRVMPLCEVKTDREYFDYEAKYHANGTQEIVPADLPDNVRTLIQERSLAIYHAFNCKGMVRIDHFWTGSELITIEINTIPGFSPESIFPKMLAVNGLGIEAAVNGLIERMLA